MKITLIHIVLLVILIKVIFSIINLSINYYFEKRSNKIMEDHYIAMKKESEKREEIIMKALGVKMDFNKEEKTTN